MCSFVLADFHLEEKRGRAESHGGAATACVATVPATSARQELQAAFAVAGQCENALATPTLRHASFPLEVGTAGRPPFQVHLRVHKSSGGRTS